MFGFFKRKRERAAALEEIGEVMGNHLRAELELYIELYVVPRRMAFLDVFRGQLETLDERLSEFDTTEEITRLEAAGIDYRLLVENWSNREQEQIDEIEQSLNEQFDIADATGVATEYRASVQEALANQKLALMSDALELLLELVPEARADQNGASNP